MKKEKAGYLSVVKVGKNYKYLQLRRSVARKNGNNGTRQIKKQVIYNFGNIEKAIDKFYYWRNKPEAFPYKLIELGYNLNDLDDWIMTIETGITKTGKTLKL